MLVNLRINLGAKEDNCNREVSSPHSIHQMRLMVSNNKVLMLGWTQIKTMKYTG
jgi:hypothetical protein